jgi:hypothetical protein
VRPVMPVSAGEHRPHPLHACDRVWTETSCSADVWIEILHALHLDPVAALGSTLSADMYGDQWRFLKLPAEDLRHLFGIEVEEMTVWRTLPEHVERCLLDGRLVTVEVDTCFLPDTVGRGYRAEHGKSTIVPNLIDRDARILEYFHNTGYYQLSGADYDDLFTSCSLPPYVEIVTLDRIDRTDPALRALQTARCHLARRPTDNPILRLGQQLQDDLPHLAACEGAELHRYLFATVRQCGATAELASAFADWIGEDCADFDRVAVLSRTLLLKLARVGGGRPVHITEIVADMAHHWAQAIAAMTRRLEPDHA